MDSQGPAQEHAPRDPRPGGWGNVMRKELSAMSTNAFLQLAGTIRKDMDPALVAVGTDKALEFLSRVGKAARYPTDAEGNPIRWQDKVIEEAIEPGASVLDLGCGDADLLVALRDRKQVRIQGVELDPKAVLQCVRKGVPVFQADLDAGLAGFPDRSVDYVILEETLQTLRRPAEVLKAMLRVGRRGFVSFPNFGYWRVRLDLALRGRAPRTEWLPHSWYDTPNIHNLSIQDFVLWCEKERVTIVEGHVLVEGEVRPLQTTDNLDAEEALIVIEAKERSHVDHQFGSSRGDRQDAAGAAQSSDGWG